MRPASSNELIADAIDSLNRARAKMAVLHLNSDGKNEEIRQVRTILHDVVADLRLIS